MARRPTNGQTSPSQATRAYGQLIRLSTAICCMYIHTHRHVLACECWPPTAMYVLYWQPASQPASSRGLWRGKESHRHKQASFSPHTREMKHTLRSRLKTPSTLSPSPIAYAYRCCAGAAGGRPVGGSPPRRADVVNPRRRWASGE